MWIECKNKSGGTGTGVEDFEHVFVDGTPLADIHKDIYNKALNDYKSELLKNDFEYGNKTFLY